MARSPSAVATISFALPFRLASPLALALALAFAAPRAASQSQSQSQPAPAGGALDLLGGAAATVRDAGPNAFGYPVPVLSAEERRAFAVGNSFFKQNWVTAPASAAGRDGLGPLFNARSCSSCHPKDGRSRPPEDGEAERHGLLVRVGVRRDGEPDAPHPRYGAQIQDSAVAGVEPEARVAVTLRPVRGEYGDGTPFELQAPTLALLDAAYGPPGEDFVASGRTAPQLIGMGLLEAIPAERLRVLADPDDRDGDGISGRVHALPDGRAGRFGWKAAQPDVAAQTAAAFANDLGITSRAHPHEDLTPAQRARFGASSGCEADCVGGAEPEIGDVAFERVVFYVRLLAVPAQRDAASPEVAAGRERFTAFGCAACHVPEHVTGADAPHAALRLQTIRPFTDLLLHDLGRGLADGKRDGDAGPREWRTPPLWGIGLVPIVNGHTRYLHDGRARDLAEAILWHGGEAESSKERFRLAPAAERASLLVFLRSL